jgi:hypothetical protein
MYINLTVGRGKIYIRGGVDMHMCTTNPDIDPGKVEMLTATLLRAKSDADIDTALEYFKSALRSEYLSELRTLLKGDQRLDVIYPAAKGFLYLAYVASLIENAVAGITTSTYVAGHYYPSVACCAALDAVKTAWLHFTASFPIPMGDLARSWAAAIKYEHPCRVPATTIHVLNTLRQYINNLVFTLTI